MNCKLLVGTLFILAFSAPAFSQEDKPPVLRPGRTLESNVPKSYTDSAEFLKLFNDFYPTIKPSLTVREQAEVDFKAIARTFKMQGIDSAEAAKAAYKNLDDSAFYKIYFQTYRKNLSAKELKKYREFISTPEGKHITEVWGSLQRVLSDANVYVARTVNTNLTPIRQAAREKMEKEQPPRKPGQGMAPPKLQSPNRDVQDANKSGYPIRGTRGDVFDQNNSASSDSLMRMQRLQNKIPPVVIPVDSTHVR